MSVSEKAVDLVFATLQNCSKGATYEELTKLTNYSIATVKNVISVLNHRGNIAQTNTRPTVLRAVSIPPKAGQTLIIHESVPPLEIDPQHVAWIKSMIQSEKPHKDELMLGLFERIRNGDPDMRRRLMVFLVNLTEVIRESLDNAHELDITDLDGETK